MSADNAPLAGHQGLLINISVGTLDGFDIEDQNLYLEGQVDLIFDATATWDQQLAPEQTKAAIRQRILDKLRGGW